MDVNTAAKLAWAKIPPSGVTMKKYSGASAWPTYSMEAPPDSVIVP